ncbi:unnamed protein product [Mucor fragilis]
MSLLGSVSGFAAFGVLVRSYALGLQKRPVFSNPSSHALAAAVLVQLDTSSTTYKKDKQLSLLPRRKL